MDINKAVFEVSKPDVAQCPEGSYPEYAFIGRSNVGKSSLINMLTGRKGLAMTSATPGKTMLINYFKINDSWRIVDLPGYGYAQRGKADRLRLEKMIRGYILNRESLSLLFLLIDVRHAPQRNDLDFIQWLGENQVPFAIIFTKLDKLSPVAGKKSITAYKEKLAESWEELPPIFASSSTDRRGRIEILNYIEELNNQLTQTT